MHFVPLRLEPKERKDLETLDKIIFESLWFEGRYNFSKFCRSKCF